MRPGTWLSAGARPPERRSPLAALIRRYYPGFFGALFLILLRTAIGWHFFYEGLHKIDPPQGEPPFSAEMYFRTAAGPFAPYYRELMIDPYARDLLARDEGRLPANLQQRWTEDLQRYAAHYNFNADQRAKAEEALQTAVNEAETWFRDPTNAQRVTKYFADLDRALARESDPEALAHERKLAYKDLRTLDAERADLVGTVDAWEGALQDSWVNLATEEQAEAAGEYQAPWTQLDWINQLTMWGLLIAGGCLMLGLLTPLAALWCAGFLTLIYFSHPPWPWLPESPVAEGHYLFVDKNLIELFACLVLVVIPTGMWIGLDALLFGWVRRRREARRLAEAEQEPAATA